MKNIYSLFILTTILACKQTQNKTSDDIHSDTTIAANSATSSNALTEYQNFIYKLDTVNVETATSAAKKYQELFAHENLEKKDKGFILFNNHYERLEKNINELHEKDTTNFDPLIMVDVLGKSLPISQKLKDYNDKLKRNGFEVSSTEGMSYIQQDREFIAKWFYSYVSPKMKEYLQQLNKENKEGFQEDAGLTIEAKQYVNRLIWWDSFIQENPRFTLVDEAKEHRKYLLTFFIIGMDNSPIIDYETNKLDDYYKTAYSYLQDNYPNSEMNKIVNPYFKALLQNDNKKAAEMLNDYKKKGIVIDFGEGL